MKTGHLESFEKKELNQFRLSFSNPNQIVEEQLSIYGKDLTDKSQLEHFLIRVQERLGAPNLMVAASLFAKRYSHCITVPALYAMSKFNKALNMESENVLLQNPTNDNPLWLPELFLIDQNITMPEKEERIYWRRNYTEQIFLKHLNPIWSLLADIGGISKQILWENTAIYVYWLYETVLREEIDHTLNERINNDFYYFVNEAPAVLFGNEHENPLFRFYGQKIWVNGNEVRKRKTCCFSYEMKVKGTMCKGCPKKASIN